MKKIISIIVIAIFTTISFINISNAKYLSSQDEAYIRKATYGFTQKAFQKYWTHKWIEKLVKIIKKIDTLRKNFKNRNIKNKWKVYEILEVIRIKIKNELWKINPNLLTSKDKQLLQSIWIIRNNYASSIFLDNWIEVYKMWKEKIDTSNWWEVIYYIRFFLEDLNDVTNPKNEVYLKKALYKNGKLSQNKFVAKLWVYSPSDLYTIWFDKKTHLNYTFNPIKNKYCYDKIGHSLYKGTRFYWIQSDSLGYISNSINELANKLQSRPNWQFPANELWKMCIPWAFLVKFKANSNFAPAIKQIPAALNRIK